MLGILHDVFLACYKQVFDMDGAGSLTHCLSLGFVDEQGRICLERLKIVIFEFFDLFQVTDSGCVYQAESGFVQF